MPRVALLLALGWLVSGCASITSGTSQSVMVTTAPATAATCTLVNDKGTWHIAQNPGSTSISKAYGDLAVTCTGNKGERGATTVSSSTGGAVFGNILIGGVIGAAVDMGSGAAYNYPSQIVVPMSPPTPSGIPSAEASSPAVINASAAVGAARLAPDEAKTRLKQLQELRETNSISETDYRVKVKAIVDQL
jgi:hypothetical protein